MQRDAQKDPATEPNALRARLLISQVFFIVIYLYIFWFVCVCVCLFLFFLLFLMFISFGWYWIVLEMLQLY